MQNYHKLHNRRRTPQTKPVPGRDMVQNAAGGYGFADDTWEMFERFLILGSAGGTYYLSPKVHTENNIAVIEAALQRNGPRVVDMIVDISNSGRAPKNDPALYALAMASCQDFADLETRRAAFAALPSVARIPTHLFHYVEYCKSMRGWGQGLTGAIANWYNSKDVGRLGYYAVKYRQRDGWTHKDMLRVAHPVPPTM